MISALELLSADGDRDFECAAVLTGHSQDVKSVAFHPHKELLVSCSYDDSIKVVCTFGHSFLPSIFYNCAYFDCRCGLKMKKTGTAAIH